MPSPNASSLAGIVQVGERDEGDADAAGPGALFLGLECLGQVVLLPLVESEGVDALAAAAHDAARERPHLLAGAVLVAVVLAVDPRAARPLTLAVERAELRHVVGHLG